MINKSNKSKAFTFAELALVLLIIGVISALTIPSLKKTSQRHELARRAQKAYFTLEECFEQALLLHGPAYKWESGKATTYINEHLKASSSVTQDNMKYTISCTDTGCDFTVDVNGENKEPNLTGKDIFKFKLTFSKVDPTDNATETIGGTKIDTTDQIRPLDDAKTLQENNWKFTDQLWNK